MRRRLETAPGCFCDLPSNIIGLHSIDDAWNRYCRLVQAQRDDERLLTDMPHQKKIALSHAHWRRLYLQTEQAG